MCWPRVFIVAMSGTSARLELLGAPAETITSLELAASRRGRLSRICSRKATTPGEVGSVRDRPESAGEVGGVDTDKPTEPVGAYVAAGDSSANRQLCAANAGGGFLDRNYIVKGGCSGHGEPLLGPP